MMYTSLYVKKDCPYCHAAHIALEEKRISFKIIELDERTDQHEIFALNPNGILPVLKEREHIIYHPEIVMLYIDERYPSPALLPGYPVERARMRLAMLRIKREWYSIVQFIQGSEDQNEPKVKDSKAALLDSFKAIEPIFSDNEFFMSETMTLADCSLSALLFALPKIGIQLDEDLGAISLYAKRMFGRESFQRSLPKQSKKEPRKH